MCQGLPGKDSFYLSNHWLAACRSTWQAGGVVWALLDPASGSTVTEGDVAGHGQALVLLSRRAVWRHGWLKVRMIGWNQALDEELDEPTIELNGFFGRSSQPFGEDFDRLLARLSADPTWDELHAPGFDGERADRIRASAIRQGLRVRALNTKPYYWVDLERVRRGPGGYPSLLSANTRQQLRRARRRIESAHGPLVAAEPVSVDEALDWLDSLALYHRHRWSRPGRRVGFEIPSFAAFHQELVRRALPTGEIQLLRVSAGDRPIAYLYSFLTNGHVQFNMSGVDYSLDEACHPGLLAHWMAVEHNLQRGARFYDFLAGDQRYKRSLSTDAGQMVWLVLWRPRAGLRLEDGIRRLRAHYRRWRRPS